ncbi:unnamed protein product [Dovyalis caffra]|uniref:RING-type E3 ubiquitin transferase n=1 Tax=Dovyalis caffra TaxID=77055 RepID=A0AAV1RFL3_9ROSI|nr:unnamed protein product [Dovyalis caffra]
MSEFSSTPQEDPLHSVNTALSLSLTPASESCSGLDFDIRRSVDDFHSWNVDDSLYYESPSNYIDHYEFGFELTLGGNHSSSSGTRVDWYWDLNSSFNNGDTENMSSSSQSGDELQELEPENYESENLSDMVIDDLLEETSFVAHILEPSLHDLYEDLFFADLFADSELDTSFDPWVLPWVDSRRGLEAAESAGESLPSVALRKDDLKDGFGVCAICMNGVVEGEMVKRLPCSHYYHGECILPWLRIKNTCPVCRYELPVDRYELSSDDQEHESWNWQILAPPTLPSDLQGWS